VRSTNIRGTHRPEGPDLARRWLRAPAAAAYLGVGASTLNKLRLTGGGPIYSKLLGGVVLYDVADLDAWAEARKVRSTSQRLAA
jgi:predicted DNA-binding transcriptional regulator AlpA